TTGSYTIAFGVVDAGDELQPSALLIDNVQVGPGEQRRAGPGRAGAGWRCTGMSERLRSAPRWRRAPDARTVHHHYSMTPSKLRRRHRGPRSSGGPALVTRFPGLARLAQALHPEVRVGVRDCVKHLVL